MWQSSSRQQVATLPDGPILSTGWCYDDVYDK
jgi:hypothetical protein